jgi:hypothetical protein
MPLSPSSLPKSAGVEITSRDLEILRGLFECRVMTLEHIANLSFDGRMEAARKRVWKLKSADLVRERPRRAYEPSVLFLTASALRLLCQQGHVTDYPKLTLPALQQRAVVSVLTIRHELDIMDVRVAFTKSIRKMEHLTLTEFSTWPRMFQFWSYSRPGMRIKVKPDGFIRFREGDTEHTFFLEVDRSTESQEKLCERIVAYLNYYRMGGLAIRNGHRKEDFKDFPSRVMIVCRTAERRNNTAARLLSIQPPILTMAMLTTMTELQNDPLGPIWMRPMDYRKIMTGTAYDPGQLNFNAIYRRNTAREEFVEQNIVKQMLIQPNS